MFVNRRINVLVFIFILFNLIILARLFYWQVIVASKAKELAWSQYRLQVEVPALRGEILASDGFPLAASQKAYLVYASLPHLNYSPEEVAEKLAPILTPSFKETKVATDSASEDEEKELIQNVKKDLLEKLKNRDLVWVPLKHKISGEEKEAIEELKIQGLGFQEEEARFYPEASMAANLLGFVGKDESGQDKGYFGLEGFYDLELKGRPGLIFQEKDAANNPILIGSFVNQEKRDGKSLVLYLDRTVQFIVEKRLKEAIKKYKAKSGFVAIMDPDTGGIIAMASYPTYDPKLYFKFDKSVFKNPVIADTYEPGSVFKIFIMAAAIDEGVVEPETKCDICDGPFKIDKYTIRTWNDKYYPDSTMTEVIQHSDNIGMVFVSQKLSLDSFWQYLRGFGFGEKTNIDLQEEVPALLKEKNRWSKIDLATASFGQGIAITGIQMVRAAAAIANGGNLVEPHMVKKIISGRKIIEIKPKVVRRVIKPETAKIIKEMMVNAVEKGEAKWTKLRGYKIAGKTGTAQIPIAGHYDEEKTIASFIGFAPVDKPRFVMLVSLREPTSSPWASETAAPLFFKITKDLLVYYGIQPD